MSKLKILASIFVVAMLVAIPSIGARAAGTGTVQSITINTDATTNETTVTVVLIGTGGLAESDVISLETADSLGLVTVALDPSVIVGASITCPTMDSTTPDPNFGGTCTIVSVDWTDPVLTLVVTNDADLTVPPVEFTYTPSLSDAYYFGLVTLTVNDAAVGTDVVIDPTTITSTTTYSKNVTLLGSYFASIGVTYDQIAAFQADGIGDGLLAQGLWMASEGGPSFDDIMNAKLTGDYSALGLDGVTNWGQLRKAVLTSPHQNLGSVVSGKATPLPTPTPTATPLATINNAVTNGNGHGNGHGNANGHSNNGNHGKSGK